MSSNKQLPSAEYLRQLLGYNPQTGVLIWKHRLIDMFFGHVQSAAHQCNNWNAKYAGRVAGSVSKNGYITIRIDGVNKNAHRVIWKLIHGKDADGKIDHIDGVKSNNKLNNLRLATHSQNLMNRPKQINNTSGEKGVTYLKKYNKYKAQIHINKKNTYIGLFDNLEDAANAYHEAAKYHFGEFARVK